MPIEAMRITRYNLNVFLHRVVMAKIPISPAAVQYFGANADLARRSDGLPRYAVGPAGATHPQTDHRDHWLCLPLHVRAFRRGAAANPRAAGAER